MPGGAKPQRFATSVTRRWCNRYLLSPRRNNLADKCLLSGANGGRLLQPQSSFKKERADLGLQPSIRITTSRFGVGHEAVKVFFYASSHRRSVRYPTHA